MAQVKGQKSIANLQTELSYKLRGCFSINETAKIVSCAWQEFDTWSHFAVL